MSEYKKFLVIFLLVSSTCLAQTEVCNLCIGSGTFASPNCNTDIVLLSSPPLRDNSPFELIFEENFDGPIDLADKWSDSPWNYVDGGSAFSCQTTNNLIVSGGYANLQTKYEEDYPCLHIASYEPLVLDTQYRDYTVPKLGPKQLFGPGKFEIRCKIPSMAGQWPAFWLYGNNPGEFNYEQEIDVFEIKQDAPDASCDAVCNPEFTTPYSASKRMIMTSHYKANPSADRCAPQRCFINATSLSNDFHTYTLIWDENVIEWFIDGVEVYERLRFDPLPMTNGLYSKDMDFPRISQKMSLIISTSIWSDPIATGINGQNEIVCGTPSMPVDFLVDYVRVWKRSCDDVKTICQTVDPQYMGDATGVLNDGVISGKIINTSSSCSTWVIPSGSTQMFRASEEINIVNFEAMAGSDFTAKINSCETVEFKSLSTNSNETFNSDADMIRETKFPKQMVLFPNPNAGNFTLSIQSPDNIYASMHLIDIFGKIVFSQNLALQQGFNQIEISNPELSSGVYFVRVDGFDESIKIIITK